MIVVTGAAGFIGSCLVGKLNALNYAEVVGVDDFSKIEKAPNLDGKDLHLKVDREDFHTWLKENQERVQVVLHIGARTDTTEFDKSVFDKLNLNYSKAVWNTCAEFGIPMIYASSGATYGDGDMGYDDNHELPYKLQPLNPYGDSKNEFDKWVLQQEKAPSFWAGLKFFNVYGPNEYHKGRMASVIWHAFRQVNEQGKVKLFRSHRPDYEDGKQLRDFVYVKDVVSVCVWLMENRPQSGLYNLGTGQARTFLDLANALFAAVDKQPNIEFVDTPEDIRDKYQYFTEANMDKLKSVGYDQPFYSLEDGVKDYVSNYLLEAVHA